MTMLKWPADRIERRKIENLILNPDNARTHSEKQIDQLVSSLREWGWTNPVLIDEQGIIIAGHGRVLAARKLGWTDIPVMIAEGWTDVQKRAYVIADNKLALNAEWDNEILVAELEELMDLDFDITLTGFDGLMGGESKNEGPGVIDETKFILMMELDSERALEREYVRAQKMGIPCKIIE